MHFLMLQFCIMPGLWWGAGHIFGALWRGGKGIVLAASLACKPVHRSRSTFLHVSAYVL